MNCHRCFFLLLLVVLAPIPAAADLETEGMTHYHAGNHAAALPLLLQAREQSQDQRLDFEIGRSYYAVGDCISALGSFFSFQQAYPENKRVRLEIAQCYARLGQHERALRLFQEAVADPEIPPQVRANIQRRIDMILAGTASPHRWQRVAMFGVGYNSNIDNITGSSFYDVFIPGLDEIFSVPSGERIGSALYDMGISISHAYDLGELYAWRNRFSIYQQGYREDGSKDTFVASLATMPILHFEEFQLRLHAGYDYIRRGGAHYLDSLHLVPGVTFDLSQKLRYEGAFGITLKRFAGEDSDRDGDQYDWSNRLLIDAGSAGLFAVDVNLGKEMRRHDIRTDVSRGFASLNLAHSYRLTEHLLLDSFIAAARTRYRHWDANFLNQRSDTTYSMGAGLSYQLSEQFTLGARLSHIRQQSNQAPFDYRSSQIKGSVQYNF